MGYRHGVNDFNITPLADVCTVLILVFLVTMPDVLWKGMRSMRRRRRPTPRQQVTERPKDDDNELLTVPLPPRESRSIACRSR